MKIVIVGGVYGGYECGSYLLVFCTEYESTEAAIVDYEEKRKQANFRGETEFYLGTTRFNIDQFDGETPQFYELNEWFDKVMAIGGDCGEL